MRKLWMLAALGLVLAGAALWAQNNQDPIPQGDFAALLASHLNTPTPAGGWNAAEAVTFLSNMGLTPFSGSWEPGATLREGDMAHVLRGMGLNVYTTQTDAVVTYARAYAVFHRYDDFFKNWQLHTRTTGGETTTHIDTGIAGTEAKAPASPSEP